MRIRACIRCGSLNLDFTPGDGMAILTRLGVGPVAGVAVCKACGNTSPPIEFENEKDYRAFLSHLKKKEGYKKSRANERVITKVEPRKKRGL